MEKKQPLIGFYSSIESFALVDGPGVRAVLFLQGCPFRCLYCHNPETWECCTNNKATADELLEKMLRYRPYWGKRGGITISGGEPLYQLDFLIEFCKKAKKHKIHICVDTTGACFNKDNPLQVAKFDKLLKYVDLFLMDIKAVDNDLHKLITGQDNKNVMDMFHYLNEKNVPIWIRYVLLPSYTLDDKVLLQTRDFIRTLNNVERVEVLPYHDLAKEQYLKLNIEYKLQNERSPSLEEKQHAEDVLECEKYSKYKEYIDN